MESINAQLIRSGWLIDSNESGCAMKDHRSNFILFLIGIALVFAIQPQTVYAACGTHPCAPPKSRHTPTSPPPTFIHPTATFTPTLVPSPTATVPNSSGLNSGFNEGMNGGLNSGLNGGLNGGFNSGLNGGSPTQALPFGFGPLGILILVLIIGLLLLGGILLIRRGSSISVDGLEHSHEKVEYKDPDVGDAVVDPGFNPKEIGTDKSTNWGHPKNEDGFPLELGSTTHVMLRDGDELNHFTDQDSPNTGTDLKTKGGRPKNK